MHSNNSNALYLSACASKTGASQGPKSTSNFSVLNISPFSRATVTGLVKVSSEINNCMLQALYLTATLGKTFS